MGTSMQKEAEPIYFSPCPQSWQVCTIDTPERLNFVLTPSVSPIRIHSGIMHNLQDTSWRLVWTRVALPCPWCWANDSAPFLLIYKHVAYWNDLTDFASAAPLLAFSGQGLPLHDVALSHLLMYRCGCVCVRCKYHQPSWQKNNTKHVQGWCLTHMINMIRSW